MRLKAKANMLEIKIINKAKPTHAPNQRSKKPCVVLNKVKEINNGAVEKRIASMILASTNSKRATKINV